mgnify:CR=1 FL=1
MCLYEWCWLCGATYTQFHYTDVRGCPGLLNGDNRKKEWPKRRIYAQRICFLLMIPIVAVFRPSCNLSRKILEEANVRGWLVLGIMPLLPIILFGLALGVLFLSILPIIGLGYLAFVCYEKEKIRARTRRRLREREKKECLK